MPPRKAAATPRKPKDGAATTRRVKQELKEEDEENKAKLKQEPATGNAAATLRDSKPSLEELYRHMDEMRGRVEKLERKMKKILEYRRKKMEEKAEKKNEKKEKKEKRENRDTHEGQQGEKPSKKRKLDSKTTGEGEQRKNEKKGALVVAGAPPTSSDLQSNLELIANSDMRKGKAKAKAKLINKPAPEPENVSQTKPGEIINDPRGSFRCYEVLNVPRTAKPEMIKKAFRLRALELHPDKPTGNHKMFLALHEAFELMQDGTQRAVYDSELVRAGSRDGLTFTDTSTMLASMKVSTYPGMICDVFLSNDLNKWPGLFAMLSNDHIVKLVRYLQNNCVPEEGDEPESDMSNLVNVGGKMATPGINRSGRNYFARVFLESSFTVETAKVPDLAGAIDGRIALLRLRSRVSELKPLSGLDDAFKLAVQELRSAEQSAAFWLLFSYKFPVPKTNRFLQTPFVQDIDVVLADKQKVFDMTSSGASLEEIQQAHENMKLRQKSQRQVWKATRDERLKKILEGALEHAKVRSALEADMLALPNKPHDDEKCEDNDEKADASEEETKAKAKRKKGKSSSSSSSSSDSDSSSDS